MPTEDAHAPSSMHMRCAQAQGTRRILTVTVGCAVAALLALMIVVPGALGAALWTSDPGGTWDCKQPNNSCVSRTGFDPRKSNWGQYTNTRGNCTNYVAYRLSRNGAPRLASSFGNANGWARVVRDKLGSGKANGTPAVGAIAWWSGTHPKFGYGGAGHVAYVEKIAKDGRVYLSDSRWSSGSARWTVTRGSALWPQRFLHIKDKPPPKPKSKPKPEPTAQPSAYRGHIVQWDGDTKQQKTAWLVGPDLQRRHIPSAAVYNCLKAKGHPGPTVLSASMLNRLTDLRDVKAVCTSPPAQATPPVQTQPPPQTAQTPATQQPAPPPPPRKVITVYNKVTNGATQMREDPIPVRLTTKPWKLCSSRGCNINGTERSTGQKYDAAVCWTTGDPTTNGNNGSSVDDGNPNLYSSDRYYRVKLGNGTTGFVSWVWIHPNHRGGLGLPRC